MLAAADWDPGSMVGREDDGLNLGLEELVPKEDARKPFWARGKDLVGYALKGLRSSGLAYHDAGAPRSTEMVRAGLGERDTHRLLSACQARRIRLSSALAAAGLISTVLSKKLVGVSESYAIATLVDCRKFLVPVLHKHNFGSYYAAILNILTVHAGEDLWAVATRHHDAFSSSLGNKKHFKDMAALNFLMCKAIDNPHLTPLSSLRTGLLTVFQDPLIDEENAAGVEDSVACASIHGIGPSIGVFDVIRGGRLDCMFVYPAPLHSREQVQGLVDHMMKVLVEASQ